MLDTLLPHCDSVIVSPLKHHRAEDPQAIADYIDAAGIDCSVFDVEDGLIELRKHQNGIILGSLYLAGEVLKEYYDGPVPIEV